MTSCTLFCLLIACSYNAVIFCTLFCTMIEVCLTEFALYLSVWCCKWRLVSGVHLQCHIICVDCFHRPRLLYHNIIMILGLCTDQMGSVGLATQALACYMLHILVTNLWEINSCQLWTQSWQLDDISQYQCEPLPQCADGPGVRSQCKQSSVSTFVCSAPIYFCLHTASLSPPASWPMRDPFWKTSTVWDWPITGSGLYLHTNDRDNCSDY